MVFSQRGLGGFQPEGTQWFVKKWFLSKSAFSTFSFTHIVDLTPFCTFDISGHIGGFWSSLDSTVVFWSSLDSTVVFARVPDGEQ